MNVLDLFSGIGGFSLGLERAGMRTVAFCEIDPYCRGVLRRHWPNVPIYENVETLTAHKLADDAVGTIDAICGGFPCQDISIAGTHGERLGIDGERSGLWTEYHRLIGELRPKFVIVENTSALLHRGLGRVLGDLAAIGYDAEWECIPAAAVGAPHIRDRVWILAYPGCQPGQVRGYFTRGRFSCDGRPDPFPEADRWRASERRKDWELAEMVPGVHPGMAAAWWRHQSSVARTADGLPGQLDRVGACGNAVVPVIPEAIGRAILKTLTA